MVNLGRSANQRMTANFELARDRVGVHKPDHESQLIPREEREMGRLRRWWSDHPITSLLVSTALVIAGLFVF